MWGRLRSARLNVHNGPEYAPGLRRGIASLPFDQLVQASPRPADLFGKRRLRHAGAISVAAKSWPTNNSGSCMSLASA